MSGFDQTRKVKKSKQEVTPIITEVLGSPWWERMACQEGWKEGEQQSLGIIKKRTQLGGGLKAAY